MQVASIDRFEGDYVVCELEDGKMIDILKSKIPYEVKEGDVINVEIQYQSGRVLNIVIHGKNDEEKYRRLQIIKERLKRINKN